MATLEELEAKRATLIGRIAELINRVTDGSGRTVTYDLTQAQNALKVLDAEIAKLSSPRRVKRIVATFTKG